MKKYARIENNAVVELLETDGDITKMFHPSLHWVDCTGTAGCSIGWLHDGVAFTAPTIPAIQPKITTVTMRQARLALLNSGKLTDVTTAINALPSPQKEAAQIEWEYSQTVERHRPFVLAVAPALGLTDAQLDDLFTLASTL